MKRTKMICSATAVGLAVVLPALAALNMFAVSFPEWVMWIPAALLIAANVLFVMKTDARRWAKIVMPAVSVLMIAAGWLGSYCNPYWSSVTFRSAEGTRSYDTVLTYQEAEDDMEQLLAIVSKCHPMFIDSCPDEFAAAYDAVIERLAQDDEITVNDLRREIQRTLSVLSDGHTTLYANYGSECYLKTVAGRKAEGWVFSAVNGSTPEQLFEQTRELFCYEADSWGIHQLKSMLSSVSGLDYLGIDADGVEFTWTNEVGEKVTDIHTLPDFVTMDEYLKYNAEYLSDSSEPEQSFVHYDIDGENDLAVLTLTSCTYNSEYTDCLSRFFTEVREQGIGNVAVDIRGNGGGNSLVVNEFIRYLDVDSYKVDGYRHRLGVFELKYDDDAEVINERYAGMTFEGDVYVLTDTGSFSSAMMFAMYIKDNNLGTLIGEAPGNDPNGYGDVAMFRLKNSGLFLSVSTKKFLRADRECTDRLVLPDVECAGGEAMNELLKLLNENG